jgi:hypothetical protein
MLKSLVSKECQKKGLGSHLVKHGVYKKLDGRLREAKEMKAVTKILLERFPDPPPADAQLLAQRVAFKLSRVASFEVFVLSGNTPSPDAERTYLTPEGQIRADIESLFRLAKEQGPAERVPTLAEYL